MIEQDCYMQQRISILFAQIAQFHNPTKKHVKLAGNGKKKC